MGGDKVSSTHGKRGCTWPRGRRQHNILIFKWNSLFLLRISRNLTRAPLSFVPNDLMLYPNSSLFFLSHSLPQRGELGVRSTRVSISGVLLASQWGCLSTPQ
ncbi:uncharacterized protein G2W53_024906 [Senna tora]|uniref:Uncharacterized protein n=1 Tax=Senna tora TaxID=362788 RepID=A0A834TE11_9FABA|nr:uncharacterized protein G2W53_024906 [Senna tora]